MNVMMPSVTLWRREVVRFLRQRNRVIGAMASPFLFWLLIGSGVGTSLQSSPDDNTFLTYAFPGTLVLVLLFTAIFATISIIEDRREGFLQSVLVAPVSRAAIVLGKIAGGATLAVGQAVIFLVFAPLIGLTLDPLRVLALVGFLTAIAAALTGMGFAFAWRMQSIQGFHAIMNLVLLPLWVLSGALFPPSGSAPWIRFLIEINPLSYGVAGVRRLLLPDDPSTAHLPSLALCTAITVAFALVTFTLSALAARGHTEGDLQ